MPAVDSSSGLDVPAWLRGWARGLYGLEAAVELLLRAFDGRFARPGWPWIVQEGECVWLDADRIGDHIGALSGGEQRVLRVVAALATGAPISDLPLCLSGLDRPHLGLLLAAFSHAGGSHQHSSWVRSDDTMQIVPLPALVPWPEAD